MSGPDNGAGAAHATSAAVQVAQAAQAPDRPTGAQTMATPTALATPQWLSERPVQLEGSAWARRVLGWFGWQVEFAGLPAKQGVFAIYPHTSNWDFPIGLVSKWAMGVPAAFWGKDSLFKLPLLGRWMRWVGGVPVDRNSAHGVVGAMVARMRAARREDRTFWLAVAPEGTRRRAAGWRSGFYGVAQGADVPLALVSMDYATRRVNVTHFIRLSGDRSADMAAIAQHFQTVHGKQPQDASPVQLV